MIKPDDSRNSASSRRNHIPERTRKIFELEGAKVDSTTQKYLYLLK
jgi:hypothetical protein